MEKKEPIGKLENGDKEQNKENKEKPPKNTKNSRKTDIAKK